MNKNIMLSIKGYNRDFAGRDNTIEFITEGCLYKKDEAYYIEYEESEISGYKGTKTLIIIEDGRISMERSGTHYSHLIFQKGRKFVNRYKTPFGNLQMGVFSNHVDFCLNDSEGKVDLKYQLDIGDEYTSFNELSMSFKVEPDAWYFSS